MPEMIRPDLKNVAATLLIPLYFRAQETQRPDARIKDAMAVSVVERLDYDFSRFQFEEHDHSSLVLRNRQFDWLTADFLARHPQAVVVHIGCGLDARFTRLDNGQVEWYDLELPEVVALRRQLIGEEGPRCHLLALSVLDDAWIEMVAIHRPRPFLFLAEGVFTYFEEAQVKALVLKLRQQFPAPSWSAMLLPPSWSGRTTPGWPARISAPDSIGR